MGFGVCVCRLRLWNVYGKMFSTVALLLLLLLGIRMCTVCAAKPRKGTTSDGQMARSRMGALHGAADAGWIRINITENSCNEFRWYSFSIFVFLHWWDFENKFTDLNGAKSQKKGQYVFASTWSVCEFAQVSFSFEVQSITRTHGWIPSTTGAKTFRSKIHLYKLVFLFQ